MKEGDIISILQDMNRSSGLCGTEETATDHSALAGQRYLLFSAVLPKRNTACCSRTRSGGSERKAAYDLIRKGMDARYPELLQTIRKYLKNEDIIQKRSAQAF